MAAADDAQRDVLRLVGRDDLGDADVERIQSVIAETGALADLESTIERLTSEAVAAIQRASLDSTATCELVALAEFVAGRDV